MYRKKLPALFLTLFFAGIAAIPASAQRPQFYTDTSHYSQVFGHDKYYRLYLPKGYASSKKRYPVIYFFHGWGGRHFKDDNALLNYEKIKLLVDKYQSILVMWDGNTDTTEPRPYNVGDHENIKFTVQQKDYFPELVDHIDSTFRTLTDRQHRGIIGFSMGGFMSFFLAGKYPEKVIAAVSLAGSPEFFVGQPDNHTLYPVRYAFKNLADVHLRMHNGDSDILYYLNDEVKEGAKWEGVPLDYWKFHGGHMVDKTGETKVFEMAMQFVSNSFRKDAVPAIRWSHDDLYPDFSVWDYHIKTNKKTPGFVSLKHVDKTGFGLYTTKWLPQGPSLDIDSIRLTTAPLYIAEKEYRVVQYNTTNGNLDEQTQQADAHGQLSFFYPGAGIETGIYRPGDPASIGFLDCHTGDSGRYLHSRQNDKLSLRLFNRAGTKPTPQKIRISLSSRDSGIRILNRQTDLIVKPGQRIIDVPAFSIACSKRAPKHAEPPQAKFYITVQCGGQTFADDFIVPVLYPSSTLDSILVDDGRVLRGQVFGKGNADGVAGAGENVLVYSGSHRLRLYTEDKWILSGEEQIADEMIPARWPDGFTVNSIVKISPDCPDGHIVEFYASYETKAFNPIERKTTWGKFKLIVRNQSNTKNNR